MFKTQSKRQKKEAINYKKSKSVKNHNTKSIKNEIDENYNLEKVNVSKNNHANNLLNL